MAKPQGKKQQQTNEERDDGMREKMVSINRVTKVVKGGRRFSFSALVVVGDGKGSVGYGLGKANEVPEAIRKATDQAKKSMIKVPLLDGTLPYQVMGRFGAGRVVMRFGHDDPRLLTPAMVRDVLAAGHTTVSGGIYVDASVGAAGPGDTVTGVTGTATVHVRVQAASWVDVATIEVYGNGRPLGLARRCGRAGRAP